jgi:hypothetical protein
MLLILDIQVFGSDYNLIRKFPFSLTNFIYGILSDPYLVYPHYAVRRH